MQVSLSVNLPFVNGLEKAEKRSNKKRIERVVYIAI